MTMRFHVERLALEGISVNSAERVQLERAVIAELTRLFSGAGAERMSGAFGGGGAVASRAGGEVRMQPGESMATLGVQVAQSVYGAIVPPSLQLMGDAGSSPHGGEKAR